MKHVPSDKYTIAWFKLAECVARGERERAFGLHRLLAHSFDDPAFAVQLEGDIFLAFDDKENALKKYKDALQLYTAGGRYIEAAAIGEHILVLSFDKKSILFDLIELYELLGDSKRLIAHLCELYALMLAKVNIDEADSVLSKLRPLISFEKLRALQEQLIFAAAQHYSAPPEHLKRHLKEIIDDLMAQQPNLLPYFLSHLETLNKEFHAAALLYLA